MKKTILFMLILMCSVALFADMPVEGGYLGGDYVGVSVDGNTVAGVLVQLSPTDMPVDVYMGAGITDTYLKGGLVLTPWEFAKVPIGMYAGGGFVMSTVTDGELVKSLSGYETNGLAEVGIVLLFTEYVQTRVGYSYYGGVNTLNVGMVIGYNKNGLGVFK